MIGSGGSSGSQWHIFPAFSGGFFLCAPLRTNEQNEQTNEHTHTRLHSSVDSRVHLFVHASLHSSAHSSVSPMRETKTTLGVFFERLKKHHAVIVAAMQAKQNADEKHAVALRKSIEDLAQYYPEQKP